MKPQKLKERLCRGWNTWYSESVTTHVLLPYGFAIHLHFRSTDGHLLDNTLIKCDLSIKTAIRSWDGRYACLQINHENRLFQLESSSRDGQQLLLVTPLSGSEPQEQVIVETGFLWGRDGTLVRENGMLRAICPDGINIDIHTDGPSAERYYVPTLPSHSLLFTLEGPVVISTVPCTLEEAKQQMAEERAAVYAEAKKAGEHAEAYSAIQCCLAWNTIYDPCKDRICTPVTRNWNYGFGSVLFCWDTFFAGLMFSLGCRDLAYQNVYAILEETTKDGMIPNYCRGPHKSYDRSQPPVGSMVVEKLWNRYGDVDFLEEVYPTLMQWNRWFAENRMTKEGYFCWGSHVPASGEGVPVGVDATQTMQGAKYESGLDNSPMYDDAVYDEESGLMLLADVGLSGLFIKDCRSLISLAEAAGHPDDIPVLKERLAKAEAALGTLWNKETGIFENRDLVSGCLSHRLSPTNFYSLFAPSVTQEQKRSMAERYLLNPSEFGGDWMLPSISRNDPAFPDQDYWRGRVWGPMNAIVYEALRDAGMVLEAEAVAANAEQLFLKEWREHRHVHENYSGVDGTGCSSVHSDPYYHWGGLLGYIAIDAALNR